MVFDNFVVTAPNVETPDPTTPAVETPAPTPPTPPIVETPAPTPPTPPVVETPAPAPTTPTVPPVAPPVIPSPTPAAPAPTTLPDVQRHYDWIRLANLAYYGTPLDPFAQSLLRDSIDLVVPNPAYFSKINDISPTTPQFAYTNVSNIYQDMLTDWNTYADQNGISREAAYYHVTQATPFSGASASSTPVDRFWGVYRGSDAAGWTDLTQNAASSSGSFSLAAVAGRSVAVGYLEKFREINVDLKSAAAQGWAAGLEYVSAADANGNPTEWKPLAGVTDGTNGLTADGRLTFDPPADWVPASVNGSASLYYVRFRTTAEGVAPVVKTLLGRDFAANNTIPAFDAAADSNGDGYLSDAEYASRRSGYDARFAYESRLFYPNYGEMRYATNVANPGFRAWAVDFAERKAAANPLATGFFVDNSVGKLAVDASGLAESLGGYADDYGSLLGAVNAGLRQTGRWLIANTAGYGATATPIVANGVSYLDEFALRPMSANTVQFNDLAGKLADRRAQSHGTAYEILDSLPTGGSQSDPRMQLATLAMYYLLADPDLSFLMVNGGNQPASDWRDHWIGAATYDVGRPTDTWSVAATGKDPANAKLTYQVYERNYDNAVVLYKPLSYNRGVNGGTGGETATVQKLDGWYRPVHADGSLGAPVNQVSLRNGEGAILAKVA